MALTEKELNKLIKEHEDRAEKAWLNYQETGEQTYYRTHHRNTDTAETLRIARDADAIKRREAYVCSHIRQWAGVLAEIANAEPERQVAEKDKILEDIKAVAQGLKFM